MKDQRHLCLLILFFRRAIPTLVQRIAGKSIPIEKFALRKTKRFTEQGKWLTLPALVSSYSNFLFKS